MNRHLPLLTYYKHFLVEKPFSPCIFFHLMSTRDQDFADHVDIVLPGILRIGASHDSSKPNLVGHVACVAYHVDNEALESTSTGIYGHLYKAKQKIFKKDCQYILVSTIVQLHNKYNTCTCIYVYY
jgi:hypothetical protein